jgi:hypothetical protein
MSQENVEIVRREYAAFAARDWEALALLHAARHYSLSCEPQWEFATE